MNAHEKRHREEKRTETEQKLCVLKFVALQEIQPRSDARKTWLSAEAATLEKELALLADASVTESYSMTKERARNLIRAVKRVLESP